MNKQKIVFLMGSGISKAASLLDYTMATEIVYIDPAHSTSPMNIIKETADFGLPMWIKEYETRNTEA